MLDADLLKLIADPETHEPLRYATADELAQLNGAISQGNLKNRGGQAVTETLSEALVAPGSRRAYAIREGIPVLLLEEALPLA